MTAPALLVMDIGNSNISIGVFEGAVLAHRWRVATVKERTSDEMGLLIKLLCQDKGIPLSRVEGVAICSVVPPLMPAIERMCQDYLRQAPLIVGPGIRTGLAIKYENPREVGADRIANAVAAIHLYGPPLIIVDVGTATTFCVIDDHGQYLGGVIAPGMRTSTEALYERAAKLPHIELTRPRQVIGRSTVTSMQSGVVYGFIGLVDGIIGRIRRELPLPYKVVATGGLAALVAEESREITTVHPHLTLEGLRILWERNRHVAAGEAPLRRPGSTGGGQA
ncbi:MAG: type III pantothenate kinase [Thermoflavifilum sp.]|nr:type III pantothenate kinase [Thermoflavifilum sp.]MCL6513222.1 type III pantothenate kinase [Alicyclobacillus sp.]